MIGLFIGTLCLLGLIATMRHRRYARFYPSFYDEERPFRGHHYPRHPHARHEGYGHQRGYRRRDRFLYELFRRLDATPGQEKTILKLAEEVRKRVDDAELELRAARRDLAAALGGDGLDVGSLDAAFQRNTELFVKLSREVQIGLVAVHEVLDADQRRLLAELIADGSFGSYLYGAHPYTC